MEDLTAVSPFQQRAMAGALKETAFHGYKRIMQQAPYFAIPIGVGTYPTCSRRLHH